MIETLVVLPRSRERPALEGDSPFSYPSPPLVERLRVLRPYCEEIVLIAGHDGESGLETGEGYRYYKVDTRDGRLRSKVRYARTVRRVVANASDPTILNFDPNLSGALFAILGKRSGARLVTKFIGLPGSDPDRLRKNVLGFQLLLRFSDEVITISPYCRDVLANIHDRDISVVPNRVSEAFEPMEVESLERSVLYVGRLDEEKRVPLLFDAFAELASREEDASLVVVGGDDGEVSSYRDLAGERGIDDRTTFTGRLPREDVLEWMNRATVLALPTAEEAFGMVVLEAMACGTPVVGHDGGALPWLIDGGGLTVDVTDTAAFAEALEEMLVGDETTERFRRGALQRASEFEYADWGEELYAAITG